MTDELFAYVSQHSPAPHPILNDIVEETQERSDRMMQISQDQGRFMHLMTKICGAQRAVEVGCFTGYSAVCMASALPDGACLYSLDINEETSRIAQRFFDEAELSDKIELMVAPALQSLETLLKAHGPDSFDLAFIDADKVNYPHYYEACLSLLRPGGVLIADNVLWGGSIVDESNQEDSTIALRAFNEKVFNDDRVSSTMLHIADGLYLVVKN
ncbi:O-methyltransferase [Pseudobacteriovorax antillogorgiicola]|nr:class I SAM-dependent methyltransferase [Pseudobacteriovorax antillogorgiicola]